MFRFSTPAGCASQQATRKQHHREIQSREAGNQIPQRARQSKCQRPKSLRPKCQRRAKRNAEPPAPDAAHTAPRNDVPKPKTRQRFLRLAAFFALPFFLAAFFAGFAFFLAAGFFAATFALGAAAGSSSPSGSSSTIISSTSSTISP